MEIIRRDSGANDGLPVELPPLLRRIYLNRGVESAAELDLQLAALHGGEELGGVDKATSLLEEALGTGERILIVGDFDADGATSCALAVRVLKAMGAAHVDYLVPNRFDYGYGLTPEIVAVATEFRPDLLITVDNGISSIDGVRAAKSAGIKVLVTDHHLAGEVLPEADAMVNPNLPGDRFPSKNLAGVGVIFYVMAALRARLRESGWFEQQRITEPNLAEYLDYVALGTVADVVPLDHNNRVLVENGLRRIRAGSCCEGIRALINVSGRSRESLVASDLGFALGPRLNAAGRLEDISLGIECLLTDSSDAAMRMASELHELNLQRRQIEAEMKQQATEMLDRLTLDEEALPFGVCLYKSEWHQGVVGILASRIRERCHRPVIAFPDNDDDTIKGSARSINGVHIRDVLDAVAARHPDLIRKFGGHAMAAGLTIRRNDLEAFGVAFDREIQRCVDADQLRGVLYSDGEVRADDISIETALQLRQGGPWGQMFPEPAFDGLFIVRNQRTVGDDHLKMILSPLDEPGRQVDAIAFGQAGGAGRLEGREVRLLFQLDINRYMGRESLQLMVRHIFPLPD